jgi:type IV secretory pathway TraG/TraD family ATPase VirD4
MTTERREDDGQELGGPLLALLGLALVLWLVPALAGLSTHLSLPDMSLFEQIFGTTRIATEGHFGDPRSAYPAHAREGLPKGMLFYIGAAGPLALIATGCWRAWIWVDALRGQANLGRRAWDLRGSAARTWATRRDLRELVVRKRSGARFTIGRLGRCTLAAGPESHVLVVAPPGAGKTMRLVVPWLLEHDGPAIVTSSKNDIVAATAGWRRQQGEVWVWDPFDGGSACWTPLHGCEDWGTAMRQAQWLAEAATPSNDHGSARFWNQEAANLLAPLLHAAAVADRDIGTVIRWVDRQDEEEPTDILRATGNDAALDQLEGVLKHEPRNRSTNYLSTGHLLAAYRYPEVRATAKAEITPEDFLDGGAHTLYICVAQQHQTLLAPIVVAMISGILGHAKKLAREGNPIDPYLRLLLDETAQIAGLPDLPSELAEARGHGLRFATVFQSVAQIEKRYGRDAGTILASSTTKLYMGPVTDGPTRQEVLGLLGDEGDPERPGSRRPVAGARDLVQLREGRAVVSSGANPPAVVTLDPYWDIKDLSGRWDP